MSAGSAIKVIASVSSVSINGTKTNSNADWFADLIKFHINGSIEQSKLAE